ncbi:MAG: ECF transporter S component [Oscillospiraceae bacterium]|nr:ECF transporter S component [Oscillospiraceae bacterium]
MRRTRPERGDSKEELNMNGKRFNTRKLTGLALLTAIVVVLQLLGSFIRFGTFSISLVLVPIVVGAALYGPWAGCWLGFVFGIVVLLSGDAAAFLAISPLGTILTVLVKGSLAGLCAGAVYNLLSRHETPAVITAAVVTPVVNTGVFLLGCLVFFMPTIREWAARFGYENAGTFMILGLVGGNFLFELLFNIVLSPVIVRLIRIARKDKN